MRSPLPNRAWIKNMGLALSLFLVLDSAQLGMVLAAETGTLTGDIRVTVNPENIRASLPIPGGAHKVTMSLHDVDIQDALRALAQKGNFNVLIDESVTGKINVDLNNVTIQDALETVKSCGNLVYEVQGNNLIAAEARSPKGQAFKKTTAHIFHLKNANAKIIADFLNSTIFADRGGSPPPSTASGASGGAAAASPAAAPTTAGTTTTPASTATTSATAAAPTAAAGAAPPRPVTADFNTNSIIVVGDPADIKVVEAHLAALDQPRQMKTWRLSQTNVLDAASALASSLFNEGQPILQIGGSSSASSSPSSAGSSASASPSSMRANAESVTEGTGASQTDGGSAGAVSGSLGSLTVRTRVLANQSISIAPTGAILLPDSRLNTLTLLGTAEQIQMADSFIALLDRKVPQLVLEATLIEITEGVNNNFGFYSGANNRGVSFGSNNTGSAFTNAIGQTLTKGQNVFTFNTNPATVTRDFFYQINSMINQRKAKILANPTIITSSDNEGIIKIVDEIISTVTVTAATLGTASSKTYNLGEVGIILNILPRVGANKMISMRVRPIVSTISDTKTDIGGNVVTLLSKRETLIQNVQVADGETFVLAGLIHETNAKIVYKNPLFANLPILGALARNSELTKKRSELVIMITPHIINDESELSRTTPSLPGNPMQAATMNGFKHSKNISDGIVPVSLSGNSQLAPNALTPLMPAHAFNRKNNGADPLEGKPLARPLPIPSGSLLPADLTPAPASAMMKANQVSRAPGQTTPHFMPSDTTTAAGDSDLSDEKIRAIMQKFK